MLLNQQLQGANDNLRITWCLESLNEELLEILFILDLQGECVFFNGFLRILGPIQLKHDELDLRHIVLRKFGKTYFILLVVGQAYLFFETHQHLVGHILQEYLDILVKLVHWNAEIQTFILVGNKRVHFPRKLVP